MTHTEYNEIEKYMLSQMHDSAHDQHHVYRVLYAAIDIAKGMESIDMDVLLAACLLHDIGRESQFADLDNICHAQIGGEMAYEFLLSRQWSTQEALHVKECISTHRYRGDNAPKSTEAKILFDADKLDASGAIGIVRTLIYEGQVMEPLYIISEDGDIIVDGGGAEISSFFQEYNYKLKNVYGSFFTEQAREIALNRQKTAVDFYNGLFNEISQSYKNGRNNLDALFDE